MRTLIDTDIWSEIFKGKNATVVTRAGVYLSQHGRYTLTAVTVFVAFVGIKSEMVKVLLALAIASVKASAVVIYFMHMKFEGKLIYTILYAPLMLAIFLTIALIPDIGLGRHTAFNDMVAIFEALVGGNGQ